VTVASWELVGGDYEGAGRATRALKERLKQLGVDAAAIRRALIAAYEAEANVVIHAHGGTMRCYFGPGQLDVEIEDHGPGIPDIDLALKEGFSTAPPAARELGFGAGMGLPNIRRNTDRFSLQSTIGRGTRVAFSVRYRPQDGAASAGHSVAVDPARCKRCRRCVRACPVQAVRLRDSGPSILEHLCVDCAACIGACPTGALALRGRADAPAAADGVTLVIPGALLVQFGAEVPPARVLAALEKLGHRDVRTLDPWDQGLRAAALDHVRSLEGPRPGISSACPAVTNLVAARFPGLLGQLVPFLSPLEAAQRELRDRPAVFVTLCPAQRSALTSVTTHGASELVAPAGLQHELLGVLAHRPQPAADPPAPASAPLAAGPELLRVTGLRGVLRVLDRIENGQLGDVRLLEAWACEGGCCGSPLLREEPAVAEHRARRLHAVALPAAAAPLAAPRVARRGLRLDADLAQAVRKLGEIDRLVRTLPGRDCGDCGAPTCLALAEDVVLGRAALAACAHRTAEEGAR
jgi:anti-sigma regulatory factor (Ser/Thr protein kinase)